MGIFPTESFRRDWFKVANLVTSLRLLVSWLPAAILLSAPDDSPMRWWAAGAFVAIAATDVVDGYIARRFKQVTAWGMFLDPLVDKLLVGLTLVALCGIYHWVIPIAVLMLAREVVITWQIKSRGQIQAAVWSGKIKMFSQALLIVILLLPSEVTPGWSVGISAVNAVLWTLLSWLDYYERFVYGRPVVS